MSYRSYILYIHNNALFTIDLIVSMDPSVTVEETTVKVRCKIPNGAISERVSWFHDGKEILLQNGKEEFFITGAKLEDAGKYTCCIGELFEGSTKLVVKRRTTATHIHKEFKVKAGEPVALRCNVTTDPTLEPKVIWYTHKYDEIDFEKHPHFKKSFEHSLVITHTTRMDTGTYICKAITDLDEAKVTIKLFVQDIPNAPEIKEFWCLEKDAQIDWQSTGDNFAPIRYYTIQRSTSITPGDWQNCSEALDIHTRFHRTKLIPWIKYSFRIIAHNEVGESPPSLPTGMCSMEPDFPNKNPANVLGYGTRPDNLVISWQILPQIEHNGPGFHYMVCWKLDIPYTKWTCENVTDWEQNNITIMEQPTYARYLITVQANNEVGPSTAELIEVIGYSGEGMPTEAPANLTVTYKKEYAAAILHWNAVPEESLRGEFAGYEIQIWNQSREHVQRTRAKRSAAMRNTEYFRTIYVESSTSVMILKLHPGESNVVQIRALNKKYKGPPSEAIEVKISDKVPGSVQSFHAFPLGAYAILLRWDAILNVNGYTIYYKEQNESATYKEKKIDSADTYQAKIRGLKPSKKYELFIVAFNKYGGGER